MVVAPWWSFELKWTDGPACISVSLLWLTSEPFSEEPTEPVPQCCCNVMLWCDFDWCRCRLSTSSVSKWSVFFSSNGWSKKEILIWSLKKKTIIALLLYKWLSHQTFSFTIALASACCFFFFFKVLCMTSWDKKQEVEALSFGTWVFQLQNLFSHCAAQ